MFGNSLYSDIDFLSSFSKLHHLLCFYRCSGSMMSWKCTNLPSIDLDAAFLLIFLEALHQLLESNELEILFS